MAQVMVNFRLDENLKREMEGVCAEMGLTMTAALTVFIRTVCREKKIPFEVSAMAACKEHIQEKGPKV